MASKKKGGNSSSWEKEEGTVQAIIVADSFNQKFVPITKEIPRTLLPVVNYVLLDYTIEYLLDQGVQDIIVFCCAHAEKVRSHIKSSWSAVPASSSIQIVMSSSDDCISLGDALREIDREGLIRTDFILVPGDLIATVNLKAAIQEHRLKRKKEKTLVMTILYKTMDPGHFSRSREEDQLIAIDPSTKRLLHFENLQQSSKSSIPMNLFDGRSSVQLRYDLSDCHIAICSPVVPPLFTDNFDYQTKHDFIRGILINEEILGNQIYCEVIDRGYSCQVSDLQLYNAVSIDIMNRWTYPQVPDSRSYQYLRHNVYQENNVVLARDCDLQQNVVIGKNSKIGTGTSVLKSVIGNGCTIGNNVILKNAFLWDNVVIEDNCTIEQTLLCSGCHVFRNVSLQDCVAAYNVKIGPDVDLNRIKLTSTDITEEEDSFGDETDSGVNESDKEVCLGDNSNCFVYKECHYDDDNGFVPSLSGLYIDGYGNENDDSSDESVISDAESIQAEPANVFYGEVLENVRHGLADNIAIDNIILEVNASKYKHNVTITEINQSIVKSIVEVVVCDLSLNQQEMLKELNKVTMRLLPLLTNYIKGNESQLDALIAAEDFFALNMEYASLMATFLHKLYEEDILEEAVILKWFNEEPQMEGLPNAHSYSLLRKNQTLQKFISWLEEAEEESDD